MNNSGRAKVLRYFHNKGFKSIIVYFDLPNDLLKDRVIRTQRSKAIFRSASSFLEVLEIIIKDPNNTAGIIQQIIAITGTRIR
ncbi:ATP-binding protein [Paenibacillus xylanivorans]|uniref:hypothetical protein n=1 Tax=Paenibacillus xylanivorans TaxID=1705561 RepID=UPI0038B28545